MGANAQVQFTTTYLMLDLKLEMPQALCRTAQVLYGIKFTKNNVYLLRQFLECRNITCLLREIYMYF